jgi:hypothetical protein
MGFVVNRPGLARGGVWVDVRAQFRVLGALFVCAVVYAFLVMTISRELVIPRMLLSTEGYISGDPQYYHRLALSKVTEIRSKGIGAFELRPEGQGAAGVASLCYLIGGGGYSVVLMNSILHGISVVLMALILLQWFSLHTAVGASIPLLISPYMMVWFSQPNKDSFVLAGCLIFTYGWLRLIKMKGDFCEALYSLSVVLSGVLLVWIMRPYLNRMLLLVSVAIFAAAIFSRVMKASSKAGWATFAASGCVVLICLAMMGRGGLLEKR